MTVFTTVLSRSHDRPSYGVGSTCLSIAMLVQLNPELVCHVHVDRSHGFVPDDDVDAASLSL